MSFKKWTVLCVVMLAATVVWMIRSLSPALDVDHFYSNTATGKRWITPRSGNSLQKYSILIPFEPADELRNRLETIMGSNESQFYLGDSCRPTCQVRIHIEVSDHSDHSTTTNKSTRWILKSLDDQGVEKTQGGDEFYVAYFDQNEATNDDPTAVAIVTDRQNGSYDLDFVTTPMRRHLSTKRRGNGILHVYFQYTCGIGRLSPTAKEYWKSGGISNLHFSVDRVPEPPIRTFQPPIQYNLSEYSSVFFHGDSLFHQLARGIDENGKQHYFRRNTYMADQIQADLTLETLQHHFIDHLQARHSIELEGRVPAGGNPRTGENVALMIGSSVWDILASNQQEPFENHLAACQAYVEFVRRTYPRVAIFWKSGTAMHVHRLPSECEKKAFCNRRTRYMSSSRAEFLYNRQKELMKKLKIPFLDLYEATYLSGYRSRPDDGRHYVDELNDQISKFLFGLES